ncbi:hypothetical protein [Paraburkholderia pallida]|uniref:Uncharacterized protein n=1 Tax=Paraburkholderia pallida TaxID=2547399 RepID=A0A4P7CSI8_9BURK|nr:hypothetical protein [Paraburkholderia pallida]QBQ97174.1 hypothetical protein E1956_08295 [Paraburkholderia pallida]
MVMRGVKIGTAPHNRDLAEALHATGWRWERDRRDRTHCLRSWWYLPSVMPAIDAPVLHPDSVKRPLRKPRKFDHVALPHP